MITIVYHHRPLVRFDEADGYVVSDNGELTLYKGSARLAVFANGQWVSILIDKPKMTNPFAIKQEETNNDDQQG